MNMALTFKTPGVHIIEVTPPSPIAGVGTSTAAFIGPAVAGQDGGIQGAAGCDIDAAALACAQENLRASGLVDAVDLIRCDAGRVPLPAGWGTTVCADLPFGMLVGSHEKNTSLYPRVLTEAARLLASDGALVVITQEVRLFERIVAEQMGLWSTLRTIPIKLPANTRDGTIRPRIYVLNRK